MGEYGGPGWTPKRRPKGRPVGDPVDKDGEDTSGKDDEGGEEDEDATEDEAVEHQPSSSKGSELRTITSGWVWRWWAWWKGNHTVE